MGATIFQGSFVKLLKNAFKIGNACRVLTGSTDPSSSATEGEPGSLYIKDDGEIFIKLDSGTSTTWRKIITEGT